MLPMVATLGELRDAKAQFDKAGAVILGCSADRVEKQAKFAAKYKLNFPLLCDPEFVAIEAYGARRMKQFLGKSFLGIVRSTFLIGPSIFPGMRNSHSGLNLSIPVSCP